MQLSMEIASLVTNKVCCIGMYDSAACHDRYYDFGSLARIQSANQPIDPPLPFSPHTFL